MQKIAFKMMLKPGHLAEYRQRHDVIWPDLADVLRQAGISDYSIHHDSLTDVLFATLWQTPASGMAALHRFDVMRRWWNEMEPLMETNPDGSPISIPLETVFHLR